MDRSARRSLRRGLLALAALALVAGVSATASAQQGVLPIREIHISNGTEDWSVGHRPFDVTRDVSIFIVFATDRHAGFQFSGQCVVQTAASRQMLHVVRVTPEWMQPGNDVIRTASFRIAWPTEAVSITCMSDVNPAAAFTTIVGPEYQRRPLGIPAIPAVVGLPTTPFPVAGPDCRSLLMSLGHPASALMFCGAAEPRCAAALLQAGHSPTMLTFCGGGVDPVCAEALLRSGQPPTSLIHCRR